ncbi:hypothetical protein [Bacteriovorax stolpii]|nr:hypothetical protein [Bacteriovorax stolpii]
MIIALYSISLTLWSSHLKSPQTALVKNHYQYYLIKKSTSPMVFATGPVRPAPIPQEKYENPMAKVSLSMANLTKYVVFSFYPWKTLLVHPMTTLNDSYTDFAINFIVILLIATTILFYYSINDTLFLYSSASYLLLILPLCGAIYIPIFHYSNFVDYWLSAPLIAFVFCLSRITQKKILLPLLTFMICFMTIKTFSNARKMKTPNEMISLSIESSPKNPLIQMMLAKQFFYEGNFVESNSILLKIKKDYSLEKEKIDNEIELNLKKMNGEFVDDQTL